jgi:hypothetical protein
MNPAAGRMTGKALKKMNYRSSHSIKFIADESYKVQDINL